MLKITFQPYNNFNFYRESLPQYSSEKARTLFTQEQFSAANYIQSNPDKITKLLIK